MCNVRIGFLFMEKYSGIKTVNASLVLDYEYIQMLRDADRKIPNPNKIIAQGGGQENMLSTPADITICGGCRGGSKTFTLLMETLKDIKNKNFRSVLLRHEIDDLSDMVETSSTLYDDFGEYNKSKNDMRWNFYKGGFLKFSYHADTLDDFKKRFQGKQFAYIGVDEITHMEYLKFKYLITCNRNAFISVTALLEHVTLILTAGLQNSLTGGSEKAVFQSRNVMAESDIALWTGTMFQVYIGEIPVRKYMSNARILYTPTGSRSMSNMVHHKNCLSSQLLLLKQNFPIM